jgi:hypothetical protein
LHFSEQFVITPSNTKLPASRKVPRVSKRPVNPNEVHFAAREQPGKRATPEPCVDICSIYFIEMREAFSFVDRFHHFHLQAEYHPILK